MSNGGLSHQEAGKNVSGREHGIGLRCSTLKDAYCSLCSYEVVIDLLL